MFPTFTAPVDKLVTDVHKVTNLLYYAPIAEHRKNGNWCTEVVSNGGNFGAEHPRAYHKDGRSYTGIGATYADRILDLVLWLDGQS